MTDFNELIRKARIDKNSFNTLRGNLVRERYEEEDAKVLMKFIESVLVEFAEHMNVIIENDTGKYKYDRSCYGSYSLYLKKKKRILFFNKVIRGKRVMTVVVGSLASHSMFGYVRNFDVLEIDGYSYRPSEQPTIEWLKSALASSYVYHQYNWY